MGRGQHDTIAYRLSQILIKLNQGEHLNPEELALEFGTHVRTIQRDLKVRLAYLPLLKTRGRYHMEAAYLGKLNFKDIERFAEMTGVKGLFPTLNRDFLKELLTDKTKEPWLVHGHSYEDLSAQQEVFSQLEKAVLQTKLLSLELYKEGKVKSYFAVQPYRLVNMKGIWYLAAVHDEKLKTFGIGKIKSVHVEEQVFSRDAFVEASIKVDRGIWQSPNSQKVLLSVSPDVTDYFKRRQLVPHQKVIRELEDGTLMVETVVGHANQILPIVRYWIPNVRILSPLHWNENLSKQLLEYASTLNSVSQDW